MKCLRCESENPASNRFCRACGAPLGLICAQCGSHNDRASKYCGSCGRALAEPAAAARPVQAVEAREPPAAGERRPATILFADLSGYTAMTERLDPEEVNEVLAFVKQAADRVVERHGGTINQFVGDEVMAVFGIPNAEEDDPVRAIKAARNLHAEMREKTGEWQARTGVQLAVHSGISTGLIFAQYRNDREGLYQLTGDAVVTAARLRSLASPDEVLVSPSTQRLVRPYFAMEARPAVSIKGKAAPLVPYRVVAESRIQSRFEAARERGFRAYIGRTAELDTLRSALSRALAGEGQFVTIEGDPGIGKSRLLYEFLSGLDREQFTVPQGRCQSHGGDIPYFPFLDGLRRGLYLSEHDSHADALRKAVANVTRIDASLERFLPFYLHLLAIPSDYALPADLKGEALRQAMEEALVSITMAVTKTQPVVFVMEDWHWSDAASQSALRRLLRSVVPYRILVIVSYRSGYGFDFGETGKRTAIRLEPMNTAEADDLIRGVTGATVLPEGLGALICRNADGNPLFVEETCYSLLESGAISVSKGRLELNQSLDRLLLPDTVQAVIRARLDRLDEGAKDLVARAAVIGRVFDRRILGRICGGRIRIEESLDSLQDQEIVNQTKIVPTPEYSFRHVLTREVAYDALPQQQRRQLHEEAGLAIEELYPERLAENAPILSYHYACSARADKAVRFALLAGERAANLYANTEASAYFRDALALAKALPDSADARRWQIDAILGLVATDTAPRAGERDLEHLEQAYRYSEELNDRRRMTQVLYWLGRNFYVRAQLQRAIGYTQRSLEIADEVGEASLAAPPVHLMGRVYWQLSDYAKSAQMMERSVEQMRQLGNRNEESTAAGFVSALFGYMGEFGKALAYSERSIALAQNLKNPFAEAAGYHYRGIIRDQQGLWDSAIADYTNARRIAGAANDAFRLYMAKYMEGRSRYMGGDPERGRRLLEESIALAGELGTTFLLGQVKVFLAACRMSAGDVEQLGALCAEGIDLARKTGDRFTEALALRTLAEGVLWGAARDTAEALRTVKDAIGIQEGVGARPELARSYVSLACIYRAGGNEPDAKASLDQAMRRFRDLGMTWDRDRAMQIFAA